MTPLLKNPTQVADAIAILEMTPESRRWRVLLAFGGVSAAEFAKAAGETEINLNRWFVNQTYAPRLESLIRVSNSLGLPINNIIEYLTNLNGATDERETGQAG